MTGRREEDTSSALDLRSVVSVTSQGLAGD